MNKNELTWARRRVSVYGNTTEFYAGLIVTYRNCVYCGKAMRWWKKGESWDNARTVEHLNHRGNSGNFVVLCCGKCNRLRRDLPLKEWFKSDYCRKKMINSRTVHPFVRKYMRLYEASTK